MSPKPQESKLTTNPLTYDALRNAISGTEMAFRAVTDLDPAGGEGDKLFPPTYQGGVYAREKRIIGGQPVPCVLLDSVQSVPLEVLRCSTSGESMLTNSLRQATSLQRLPWVGAPDSVARR